MSETKRTGSRRALPGDAMRKCPSCSRPRGNVRTGWHAIMQNGVLVGYTCSSCPRWDEPIRLESSGRLVAVVGVSSADGKRKQIKRRFDALDQARAWVEEVRAGSADATRLGRSYSDPSRLTVSQICERWLDHRAQEVGTDGGIRPGTVAGYRKAMKSLLAEVGAELARELTPGQIEAALRKLALAGGVKARPMSHRSLTYAMTGLRQAYRYGQREGWLQATTNPAQLAKVPGKPAKVRQARRWTVEELQTFRAYVDAAYSVPSRLAAEPWAPTAMRLVLCGLRRSEVLGLDWAHVNFDDGTIEVTASRTSTGSGRDTDTAGPKTQNSHRVVAVEELHAGTSKLLQALWLRRGRPASGLVVSDNAGEPIHPDSFSWRFRSLVKEAGVPWPGSVHNLRHTLATALQEAGVPDNQGAALLGHDVATYRRFYVLADQDAAASAAKIAGTIFAPKVVASSGL